MLYKNTYVIYIQLITFLLSSLAIAQDKSYLSVFPSDKFLSYDTMFLDLDLPETQIQLKEEFNAEVVALRLDSLNSLTPINLVYNTTVGQYIKFYLQQRPEQVSKLLALSDCLLYTSPSPRD